MKLYERYLLEDIDPRTVVTPEDRERKRRQLDQFRQRKLKKAAWALGGTALFFYLRYLIRKKREAVNNPKSKQKIDKEIAKVKTKIKDEKNVEHNIN